MVYDYLRLTEDVLKLSKVHIIGKSIEKRNIYMITVGAGDKLLHINAAHHGLEWLTSAVCMELARFYDANPPKVKIQFVPMVNPDGVEIATKGISCRNRYYELLKEAVCGLNPREVWQANARGVDINHNYDAGWEKGVESAKESGYNGPCYTRFGGEFPNSEPETVAVVNQIKYNVPDCTICLHSQGEVIYWEYQGESGENGEYIAKIASDASGYELDKAEGTASFSGCKDWVIKTFGQPGLTVEMGMGKNPLDFSHFEACLAPVSKLVAEIVKVLAK